MRICSGVRRGSALVELGNVRYIDATTRDEQSEVGVVPANRVQADGTTIIVQDAQPQSGKGRIQNP